jgi:ubiquinone/menaquinone biosynthesis C-methylase UbiE
MMNNTALVTRNRKGFSYKLSTYGEAFVAYAKHTQGMVMDVGAAYGVATLPALQSGAKVVAVDIDENHLNILHNKTKNNFGDNLVLINKKFPYLEFEANTFDAVYISQVFPFLMGAEIVLAIEKIAYWLKEGGKLFLVSFTPYLDHVKSYIPEFESRRKAGEKWPGYIENLAMYSDNDDIAANLPNKIHHLDEKDISIQLFKNGFMIEKLEYFGAQSDELPQGIQYDGRERLGIIARKL